LRLIRPYMAGVYEGGLHARWSYYHEAILSRSILNIGKRELQTRRSAKVNNAVLSFVLNRPHSLNFVSPATALDLNFFNLPVRLCCALFGVAVMILLGEVCFKFRIQWKHSLRKKGLKNRIGLLCTKVWSVWIKT